jgi:hypothetical protein
VALQKSPKRAATAGKPALAQGRHELVERPVRLLSDQSQDLVRVSSSGDRLPPHGLGVRLPSFCQA